ncbi:hypothetical protein [Sinomonas sp. ASV322]|uniref:hypothetical protein n=1 Tax=Sinomonas sp. ASV322 TaxID=3041920 RepID=UPI0027DBB4B7|nr:hypothetical protein [Sinomonas sp. ASV322]MDQ4502994.1 hypothetical protein [Sinomonas sp. ASV322]
MSLFRKRAKSAKNGSAEREKPTRREIRAFRDVLPYEMDEKIARRIAMRAYGDDNHDGEPDIPRTLFPG